MATIHYDADDFYMLKSEANEVKLRVQIGEELAGAFLIFNGTEFIGANTVAVIGKADYLDAWITISVVIKHQPERHSWASVMVSLLEDSQIPKTFGPYRRKMEEHVDTVCYTLKINIRKNSDSN